MRIGLVRSAIGYSPPSNYNGHFKRETWYPLRKKSLSLYNGHFLRQLAGRARVIFWNRISPPTLQRTIFCELGGYLQKILFNLQRTFSPRKTGVCLKKVKIKMLPALEKAEASWFATMRFQRTASTAAVRTQRRNERSGLSASLLICSCWEHPNPYKNATLLL